MDTNEKPMSMREKLRGLVAWSGWACMVTAILTVVFFAWSSHCCSQTVENYAALSAGWAVIFGGLWLVGRVVEVSLQVYDFF